MKKTSKKLISFKVDNMKCIFWGRTEYGTDFYTKVCVYKGIKKIHHWIPVRNKETNEEGYYDLIDQKFEKIEFPKPKLEDVIIVDGIKYVNVEKSYEKEEN